MDHPKNIAITGSGNATAVFATVKAIIDAFMKKHPGDSYGFSGAGASRQKLYDRLVSRYAPKKPSIIRQGDVSQYRFET
jgi:hypothetical protein